MGTNNGGGNSNPYSFEKVLGMNLNTVERLHRTGFVDETTFAEYVWLWRNSVVRFGTSYQHLEGKPAPTQRAAEALEAVGGKGKSWLQKNS